MFVQIIDDVIVKNHFLSHVGVGIHKRIETFFQNPLGGVRHNRQIHKTLEFRLLDQLYRAFADVHGNVADALEILHNLERRCDKSEVARDRLFECQDFVAQVVDFNLKRVQFIITFDHFVRQRRPPIDKSSNRIRNHDLGFVAHQ